MCSNANCGYANSPPMNHATPLAHADVHPMPPLESHVLPPNHTQLACPMGIPSNSLCNHILSLLTLHIQRETSPYWIYYTGAHLYETL